MFGFAKKIIFGNTKDFKSISLGSMIRWLAPLLSSVNGIILAQIIKNRKSN